MELGKRLQECRKSRNVTQEEMADACGLSKNYISAMERGINKCSAQTLIAYGAKLGMSLDEIVGNKNDVIPELQQALKNLSEEKQEKVLQVIRIFF